MFAEIKSLARAIFKSTAPSIVRFSTPVFTIVLPMNPETFTVATLVKVRIPSPILAFVAETGPSSVSA